jgi:hypothetical protein
MDTRPSTTFFSFGMNRRGSKPPARSVVLASRRETLRTQQTSDVLGAKRRHGWRAL